jgi:hypothetical protein
MTDAELLDEIEHRFEDKGTVPFSPEEGNLVERLPFTSRSLTRGSFREAWNGFIA